MTEGQQPSSGELQARAAENIIQEAQLKQVAKPEISKAPLTPPPQEHLSGEAQEAADRALFTDEEWRAIKQAPPELNQIIQDLIIGGRREEVSFQRHVDERVAYVAASLGKDTLTLTPAEKTELFNYGRFLTDEERKKHAEIPEPPKLKPLTVEQRIQMYKTMLDEVRGRSLPVVQRQEQEQLATKLRGKKKKMARATLTDLSVSLLSVFSKPSQRNQLTANNDTLETQSTSAQHHG